MHVATVLFSFLVFGVYSSYGQTADVANPTPATQQEYPKTIHPAEFPGGSDELGKYLAKHLRYPSSLLRAGIYPPPIMVSFTVAETGVIKNVEVMKLRQQDYMRLEPYLIKVVNVLENMPHWKPATNGNIAVASRHVIPVTIDVK